MQGFQPWVVGVISDCSQTMILFPARWQMPDSTPVENEQEITRDRLAELLNEDLSREYQAIIAYVVYSQVLKGATYMNIADQLAIHATEELAHAIAIAN